MGVTSQRLGLPSHDEAGGPLLQFGLMQKVCTNLTLPPLVTNTHTRVTIHPGISDAGAGGRKRSRRLLEPLTKENS